MNLAVRQILIIGLHSVPRRSVVAIITTAERRGTLNSDPQS
jgi:hypothetical protein